MIWLDTSIKSPHRIAYEIASITAGQMEPNISNRKVGENLLAHLRKQ